MSGFFGVGISIVNKVGSGKAAAKIAYITRQGVRDLEAGVVKHPSSKEDCISSGIIFPDWLSEEARQRWSDPATLAYDTERAEKDGGQIMRSWIINFDKSLSEAQIDEATREIGKCLAEEGMWVMYAQHDGGDTDNKHVHLLTPARQFDAAGHYLETKTRQVFANDMVKAVDPKTGQEVDRPIYNPSLPNDIDSGRRIPRLDKEGNQKVDSHGRRQWMRVTVEANPWNDRNNGERWRAMIAEVENKYLDMEHQVDHRSYARQGIDKQVSHIPMSVNAYKMHERLLSTAQNDPDRLERYIDLVEKIQHAEEAPLTPEEYPARQHSMDVLRHMEEEREQTIRQMIQEKERLSAQLREELRYKPRVEYYSRFEVHHGVLEDIERLILGLINLIRQLFEELIQGFREAEKKEVEEEIQKLEAKLKEEMYLASAIGVTKGCDQSIMVANEFAREMQKRLTVYMSKMFEEVQQEQIRRDETQREINQRREEEEHQKDDSHLRTDRQDQKQKQEPDRRQEEEHQGRSHRGRHM